MIKLNMRQSAPPPKENLNILCLSERDRASEREEVKGGKRGMQGQCVFVSRKREGKKKQGQCVCL